MCGIAGYLGKKRVPRKQIIKTLNLMKNRGPDNQSYKIFKIFGLNLYLLHSRLNIIDIKKRSNQPFIYKDYAIVFNGEIYNYLEIKKKLELKGFNFSTTSDTEVLLKAYIAFGENFLDDLEGMWSFVIIDNNSKKIFMSRDRFGEKPLYYHFEKKNFYFGSEVKFIKSLSNIKLKINKEKILKYLFLGYKSLKKENTSFFEKIYEFPKASFCTINNKLNLKFKKYWSLNYNPKKISSATVVKEVKKLLSQSIKLRLRSDVPIASSLSGGVDSNVLIGYAKKKFKKNTKCYSIIDKDKKYNESKNIKISTKYLKTKYKFIKPQKHKAIENLEELIVYHDSPISTINFFVHSFLTKKVAQDGYKVIISGIGADEIFSGYYDHTLQFLQEIRKQDNFRTELNSWKKKISVNIKNPIFKDPKLYIKNKTFRDHLYNNHKKKLFLLKGNHNFLIKKFNEHNFSKSLMRNRMLNELFFEAVPVILHEEDLNSMKYSLENRAPYLDRKLIEFMYTVPTKMLIQKGFTKFFLRKAGEGFVNKKILTDTRKIGFNYSIDSIINVNSEKFKTVFLSKKNKIFSYINYKKFIALFNEKKIKDDEKFLFNFINTSLFLKNFG